MADAKISALTNLTAADAINDMIPIVDVSDTPPASGNTKRISINNILSSSPTASGALTVTGLVTAGSATITGAATVGTTLGVTGASTLASVGVTGAATVGTTLLVGTNATLTNGNVIIGTSGKGIDFSATTSGSGTMTSELLNDYEEGTWTPNIGGTATYTTQAGRYTKVGRLVTATFDITILLRGTGSTTIISGLPFTETFSVGAGNAAILSYFNGLANSSASIYGFVDTAAITLNTIAAGGSTGFASVAVITNGTRIAGTVVYSV